MREEGAKGMMGTVFLSPFFPIIPFTPTLLSSPIPPRSIYPEIQTGDGWNRASNLVVYGVSVSSPRFRISFNETFQYNI